MKKKTFNPADVTNRVMPLKPLQDQISKFKFVHRIGYDTDLDIIQVLNKLRTDPESFISILQDMIGKFDHSSNSKMYQAKEKTYVQTREGASGVRDAIKFLRSCTPCGPLARCPMLSLAACGHSVDLGSTDTIGHVSSDGSSLYQRLLKHGKPIGEFAENISYGCGTGEETICQLFIDDGNKLRQ